MKGLLGAFAEGLGNNNTLRRHDRRIKQEGLQLFAHPTVGVVEEEEVKKTKKKKKLVVKDDMCIKPSHAAAADVSTQLETPSVTLPHVNDTLEAGDAHEVDARSETIEIASCNNNNRRALERYEEYMLGGVEKETNTLQHMFANVSLNMFPVLKDHAAAQRLYDTTHPIPHAYARMLELFQCMEYVLSIVLQHAACIGYLSLVREVYERSSGLLLKLKDVKQMLRLVKDLYALHVDDRKQVMLVPVLFSTVVGNKIGFLWNSRMTVFKLKLYDLIHHQYSIFRTAYVSKCRAEAVPLPPDDLLTTRFTNACCNIIPTDYDLGEVDKLLEAEARKGERSERKEEFKEYVERLEVQHLEEFMDMFHVDKFETQSLHVNVSARCSSKRKQQQMSKQENVLECMSRMSQPHAFVVKSEGRSVSSWHDELPFLGKRRCEPLGVKKRKEAKGR